MPSETRRIQVPTSANGSVVGDAIQPVDQQRALGTAEFAATDPAGQDWMKARRSALIVAACVVGMPCGNPEYVFNVPFCNSFADSGPESA